MEESATTPGPSGLLVAVQELAAVHDRSGDAPWPGGDGNLHDSE
jgi:hypothetical protein